MEKRIEIQKAGGGEILFGKLEKTFNGDYAPEYDPAREERYNTTSLGNALDYILVHFGAIKDLMNRLSDDNAEIVTIFGSVYRDAYQQMGAIIDFIKESIGEIEFKFVSPFTCGVPLEPEALTFKPGELLLKGLASMQAHKNQGGGGCLGGQGVESPLKND